MNYRNRLLAVMPAASYSNLVNQAQSVALNQGDVLHRPGDPIEYVYFPLDCLLSITLTMQSGATAETGLVGNRGLIGINAFMQGSPTTQTTFIVQIPGQAIKLLASTLRQEFNASQELRDILLSYTQAFIAQISQTTACNRLHSLEQRFARWLLEAQDRTETHELPLTQEMIAYMLGVRRAGVSQAAQKLQESGTIRYNRGHVRILNQPQLKSYACECFRCVRNEYGRLLGHRGEPFPVKPH